MVLPFASVIAAVGVAVGVGMWVGTVKEKFANFHERIVKLEDRIQDTPTMSMFNELKQEVKSGFDKIMDYLQKQ